MNANPSQEHFPDGNLDYPAYNVAASTPETVPGPGEQSPAPHERWTKLPKTRGRQPRDPHAQVVRLQCRNIDELETHLHDYLNAPTVPAEHATIELVFPVSAAFMVYTADLKNKRSEPGDNRQQMYGRLDRSAISVIEALAPSEDAKDQMRRQKAISKVCVEACERADGFRYSFHNNWLSREDEACRFSYFCNDSTLNKGRAANEGAGMLGKKKRKPVYDCQGLIAIKFSATKQNLEIHYKHIPLHKTYAERAPPPRRDSKRRKLMEVFDPASIPAPKQRHARDNSLTQKGNAGRPQKRAAMEQANGTADAITIEESGEGGEHTPAEAHGSSVPASVDPVNASFSEQIRVSSSPDPSSRSPSALRTSSAASVTGRQTPVKAKRPTIPGSMVGSVQNGLLDWGRRTSSKDSHNRTSKKSASAKASQSSAPEPTANMPSGTASIALSELEALKQKLEEAEARIKRLESEKAAPPQMQPPLPPQHVLWPPPPGYPTSYPPLPTGQQFPTLQAPTHSPLPQQQLQHPFHLPQTSQRDVAEVSTAPAPVPAVTTTPTRNTHPKPVVPKFVLYTPKTKQTSGRNGPPVRTSQQPAAEK